MKHFYFKKLGNKAIHGDWTLEVYEEVSSAEYGYDPIIGISLTEPGEEAVAYQELSMGEVAQLVDMLQNWLSDSQDYMAQKHLKELAQEAQKEGDYLG